MSKPTVDTDAIRAARKAATVTIGHNAHGQPVYAQNVIDPKGHLVQVRDGTKIKDGFRYATSADVEAKRKAEADRVSAAAG